MILEKGRLVRGKGQCSGWSSELLRGLTTEPEDIQSRGQGEAEVETCAGGVFVMGGLAEKKGREENLSIKVDQWKAGWLILRWFHEDLGKRRV